MIDFAQWGWGQWYMAAFLLLQLIAPARHGFGRAHDVVVFGLVATIGVAVPFYALLAGGFWQ